MKKIDFTPQFPQNGRFGERCYDAGRLRRRCRRRKRFGCQCRCYRCRFVSSGGAGTFTGMTSYPVGSESDPNNRTIFKRLEEATNVHIDWTAIQG